MDREPQLRDIHGTMWIRPNRQTQARMPSMRPQPASTAARAPASDDVQQQSLAAAPAAPPLTEEELQRKRAGGFHESSYELQTGMDIFESDWPDDVTIPGALDDR